MSNVIRFRRFSHKAYAAFASMHRQVTIGRVSHAICDLELLKQGRAIMLGVVTMTTAFALADDSPTGLSADGMSQQFSLQEVLVQANKTDATARSYRQITSVNAEYLRSLPVTALPDMLQYLPGLDVRTRGNNGVQADISLRGGTFDQVRVLLNGIDLSDAHTGHYAMNLPLSASLIDRIEVLDGAVNIVAGEASGQRFHGRLSAGMNGLVNPEFSARWQRRGWQFSTAAEYNRADGATAPHPSEKEQTALENSDYRIANFYFRAKGIIDIQAGVQYKDAGAGMFYGFGSQSQRDETATAFASAAYRHQWGAWSLDAKAMYRINYDYYRWWRNEPTKGANKHLTQNAQATLNANYVSKLGTTSFGISLRNENIYSTNLGDSISSPISLGGRELPLGDNRLDVNYFASQTFHYRFFNASLRADGHYNSCFGLYGTGHANIGFDYAGTGNVYLNASYSRRLPSFTDLYYKAGVQRGDRNLRPEQMTTLTVGNRYSHRWHEHSLAVEADGFYRLGQDIIDWVYREDDKLYHATNQNRVNGAGCEATLTYRYGEWLPCVRVNYAYTWLDLDLKKTGSRYLDYLSHKLTAHIEHGIYVADSWRLGAAWTLTYKVREGQYNNAEGDVRDYRPVLLLDGQVYWEKSLGDGRQVRVSADATNLTNRHYYDYGGILQPGTWAKGTVSFTL